MKSSIKKTILVGLIVLMLLSSIKVQATELYSLEVDVELLENGDGRIDMYWDYYDDTGTEHYIPISGTDIGIKDLEVWKDGRAYEIREDWDVDASFDNKAYKAGIRNLDGDYEICWGISSYGNSVYQISYTVEGMVKNLEDAQFLFYKFVNDDLSEAPEQVKIKIHSENDFTKDDIKFWGFGMEGFIELEEGKIIFESEHPLSTQNYATVLIRFAPDYFNSEYSYPGSFEEIKDKAFEGSIYEDLEEIPGQTSENDEEIIIEEESDYNFIPFAVVGTSMAALAAGVTSKNNKKKKKKRKFGIDINDYENQYYRDIPYRGRMEDLYLILNRLELSDYSDYITYYFLKWVKDGAIEVKEYETGIFFKKEKEGFKIIKEPNNPSELEDRFFEFLVEAAGDNGILEESEFDLWMGENTREYEDFIEDFELESEFQLLELGYIEYGEELDLFTREKEIKLTEEGKNLTENLIGFKNYLYDFSLLNERESVNIHLWETLMLYAAIFGITERVQEEFKELYPNYMEETIYTGNILYVSHLYSLGIRNSYHNEIHNNHVSASSGFGGGTGFGGGGGSFGGGSGGGTR